VIIDDLSDGVVSQNIMAWAELMLSKYHAQCIRLRVQSNNRYQALRENGGEAYDRRLSRGRINKQNLRARNRQRIVENQYDT
jgi:hypothetical protein